MTLQRSSRPICDPFPVVAFLAASVGSALCGSSDRLSASEVIAAIPGAMDPAAVVDPIEPGTHAACTGSCEGHGGHCSGGRCTHGRCGHGACRRDGCEVPGCPAHCPVRPATFGYYDTQWRTWPGHEVEQASRREPAAPVMPPKSEVPKADEESPVPGFEAPLGDSMDSMPAERMPLELEPSILPPPDAEQPEPQPQPTPSEKKPADEKPAKEKADDANLFDEASLRRRSQERLARLGQAAVQQERLRQEALRQQSLRFTRPSATDAGVRQATHLAPPPARRTR